MSYYYPEHVHFTTAAGTGGETSITFHERMEVVSAKVVDFDGIAADGTNYATFQILGNDKATVLFQWATLTSAQGALTANVSADLVSQNNQDKAIFAAGDVLIIKVVKASSGKATKASVCLQLRQARSY
tara:strand:+ start:10057 stop:10443 length:387 start_codon:yes stop_codon:yes gene_type:complete